VSTDQPSHDDRGDGIRSVNKYVNLFSPVGHQVSDDNVHLLMRQPAMISGDCAMAELVVELVHGMHKLADR
jgi:hypothetical protein